MSEEDKLFQAEQVDEQIELLTDARPQQILRSSDARLISNLRQVYGEDHEIVEHVWAKLTAQAAQKRQVRTDEQNVQGRLRLKRDEDRLKGPQPMQKISQVKQPQNTFIRLVELSAACLVVVVLVGSMVFLLRNAHQRPIPVAAGTATTGVSSHPTTPARAATATPTRMACNTAHPVTLTPLSGRTDPAVFYLTGGGGYQTAPSTTSLIRYDLATGGQTTLVPPASNSGITDVTLSPDKQWLLFSTYTQNQNQFNTKLQVIRTDGSMLQTLYESCSASSFMGNSLLAWSPNEQVAAFPASSGINVLDLTTGKLQIFLPGTSSMSYEPAFWVNNQQLLVRQYNSADTAKSEIYLLDISKGVRQQVSDLSPITSMQTFCGNLALSSDGLQLFSSSCSALNSNCRGTQVRGPGTVSVLPSVGGAARTIYSSQSKAITAIYPASASSLLIYIENTAGDLSQDGLWKINTDGSNLTWLTTTSVLPCQYSVEAYPLTQISSDGQSYALLYMDGGVQKVIVGSLAGGSPTTLYSSALGSSNVLVLVGIGVA